MAADKARGQHTEISFESMTLQLSSLERFRCDESDLWPQLEDAIRSAEKYPLLRDIMNQLLDELRPLLMASQPSC